MDRQKNQLQCNLSGKECSGDSKEPTDSSAGGIIKQQAGCPWKKGVKTLSWDPQLTAPEPEKYTNNNQQQKAAGLLSATNGRLETQSLLKSEHTHFHFLSLTQGSGNGGEQHGLEMPEERLGTDALERVLREEPQGTQSRGIHPNGGSHCPQAKQSPLSNSTFSGNNSPNSRRNSALPYGASD